MDFTLALLLIDTDAWCDLISSLTCACFALKTPLSNEDVLTPPVSIFSLVLCGSPRSTHWPGPKDSKLSSHNLSAHPCSRWFPLRLLHTLCTGSEFSASLDCCFWWEKNANVLQHEGASVRKFLRCITQPLIQLSNSFLRSPLLWCYLLYFAQSRLRFCTVYTPTTLNV